MKTKFLIRLLLQGKEESFDSYENRLNEEAQKMQNDNEIISVIIVPSAAADGRMYCVINYTIVI